MNEKYFLPIGSVVLLKEAKKRIMITGFCMKDKNSNIEYDYCGCLYPEGIIDTDKIALFNHDQIDTLFFIGMQDAEEISFKKKLRELLKKQNTAIDQVNNIADNNNVEPNTNIVNN